jgi:hypothetical protein
MLRAAAVVGGALVLSYGSLVVGSSLYVFALRRRLRRHARLVVVRGHEVNVTVVGDGDVTVVLDAGLGMSSLSWHWVQSIVAQRARVVAFDRPALGCSPASASGTVGMSFPDGWHAGTRRIRRFSCATCLGLAARLACLHPATTHVASVSESILPDRGHEGLAEGKRVAWLRGVGDIVTFMHDLLDVLDEEDRECRRRRRSSLPRMGSYNQLREEQRQSDLKTENTLPRPNSGSSVEDWVAQASKPS